MSILKIESKRHELFSLLNQGYSGNLIAYLCSQFFDELIQQNHSLLSQSYTPEILPVFINSLQKYEVYGTDPEITRRIINISRKLYTLIKDDNLKDTYESIERKLEHLEKILAGVMVKQDQERPCFPLIEDFIDHKKFNPFLFLETVEVTIYKAQDKTTFVVVPSEKEIESRIKIQVETSWQLACSYVSSYFKKLPPHHKIIINFEKRYGWYAGDSLGVLLTIIFIEELLKFYNATFYLLIKKDTAFTGGMTEDGSISSVSEQFIRDKTIAVFFSRVTQFAVPQQDKPAAVSVLKELNQKYPERKLNIIGVEDLTDLINRRNIVELNKRSILRRGVKAAKQNYLSLGMLVILLVVVFISGLWDFDRNPATLKIENEHIRVYNKNNKLLWSEKANKTPPDFDISRNVGFIFDSNGDGINEVILSNHFLEMKSFNVDKSAVLCLDYAKRVIWTYKFSENVSSSQISFDDDYRITFLPTNNIDSAGTMPVIALNYFYPCALFYINLMTGEKTSDVFWHSGHFISGSVFHDKLSGAEKIIAGGVNNGYEAASIVVLDKNELNGQAISTDNYLLNDIPLARVENYILLPPTDYSEYTGNRYNAINSIKVIQQKENYLFMVEVVEDGFIEPYEAIIYYYFNPDMSLSFIESGDVFQYNRDKLVKEGKLKPPLTYTKEYFDILKNNIRYWDGEKFVKGRDTE